MRLPLAMTSHRSSEVLTLTILMDEKQFQEFAGSIGIESWWRMSRLMTPDESTPGGTSTVAAH